MRTAIILFGLQTPKTTALSLFDQIISRAATTSTPGIRAPTAFGFGLKTPTTGVSAVTGSSVSITGFGFGLSTAKPGSTLSSGMSPFGLGPTASSSSVASSLSFGTTTQPTTVVIQPTSIGFSVLASTNSVSASLATAAAQNSFTLGTEASTGVKPLGTLSAIQKLTGVPSITISAPPQIGLGLTAPQPPLPNLGFQPLATTVFTLGTIPMSSSTTSTVTGLGLGSSLLKSSIATTTGATPVSDIGFDLQTSTGNPRTSVMNTSATGLTAPATTTAVTHSAAAVSKNATLTYNQLEDLISKWAWELDDQER
ncbi:hypothetical protein D915_011004 [Fasciola hepatica]|uniref:Uncharacterized protein n=1 Tax=Fasciola hepatica TaxID=6192 RepID=A0A4E0R8E0_FASHE|nr:hypothetical protein D915_011004 [Fasciola hepatica]